MKRNLFGAHAKRLAALLAVLLLLAGMPVIPEAKAPLITSADELTAALMNAGDGDTILVGDIVCSPMPKGMIQIPKNVTVKGGGDTPAILSNATFVLNGTASDSFPLTVRFENIAFRGDLWQLPQEPDAFPSVGTEMPELMNTMCASILCRNVDAVFTDCSFEGYHYGYGGVINAVYSSGEDQSLRLTLQNCSFRNNAAKYGGCLYLDGYNRSIRLSARHCSFDGNSAGTGGAIFARDADIRLLDCSFTDDRCRELGAKAPDGGALALYNCVTELDGCLIAGNTAPGRGGGIRCEISPFRTLIMKNCTVAGNRAAEDEGISLTPAESDYDTPAAAYIYFSSLVGRQDLGDLAKLFGCLLAGEGTRREEPGEENGHCLRLPPEEAGEKGLLPDTPRHISLPEGEYPVPKEKTDGVAGGRFSDSIGELQVGDNYRKEAVFTVREGPGREKTVTVPYGEVLTVEEPERSGYSFAGWEYPGGIPFENGRIFIGGRLPGETVTARWHFLLREHLYVMWIPLAALLLGGIVLFRRMKKTPVLPLPAAEKTEAPEAAKAEDLPPVFPPDWIDRVCEKPEITGTVSKREAEVLRCLLEGKSRKQIAEELFVTEATVRKHSTSIYAKLGVHNRTELVYKLTKQ